MDLEYDLLSGMVSVFGAPINCERLYIMDEHQAAELQTEASKLFFRAKGVSLKCTSISYKCTSIPYKLHDSDRTVMVDPGLEPWNGNSANVTLDENGLLVSHDDDDVPPVVHAASMSVCVVKGMVFTLKDELINHLGEVDVEWKHFPTGTRALVNLLDCGLMSSFHCFATVLNKLRKHDETFKAGPLQSHDELKDVCELFYRYRNYDLIVPSRYRGWNESAWRCLPAGVKDVFPLVSSGKIASVLDFCRRVDDLMLKDEAFDWTFVRANDAFKEIACDLFLEGKANEAASMAFCAGFLTEYLFRGRNYVLNFLGNRKSSDVNNVLSEFKFVRHIAAGFQSVEHMRDTSLDVVPKSYSS